MEKCGSNTGLTLPKQARYQLRYTRICLAESRRDYYTVDLGKMQEKILYQGGVLCYNWLEKL